MAKLNERWLGIHTYIHTSIKKLPSLAGANAFITPQVLLVKALVYSSHPVPKSAIFYNEMISTCISPVTWRHYKSYCWLSSGSLTAHVWTPMEMIWKRHSSSTDCTCSTIKGRWQHVSFHLFSIFWLYMFCIIDLCSVSCISHHFLPAFCGTRGELFVAEVFDQFGCVTVTERVYCLAKKPFVFWSCLLVNMTISVILTPLTLALAIDTGFAPRVT